MENKTLEYLFLGALGACGFLIGWFRAGEQEYKKYAKELESLLEQSNELMDAHLKVTNDSIRVRDEVIENLTDIVYRDHPDLKEFINHNMLKKEFSVLDNQKEVEP